MKRLADTPELLDGPLDPTALAGNLRDLARVNRWLGGSALSWRALLPLLSSATPTTLLDIGTGSAAIPRDLLHRAARGGMLLEICATDPRPEIVAIAQRESEDVAGLRVAPAAASGRLDQPDRSWDVVHASLVLHHLDEPDARKLLVDMARVSRRAVIVNDLTRGRAWWLGAWLLTRVATGNRYTRHDAPLSVSRAYRADELTALADAAGMRLSGRSSAFPPYRYALTFVPAGSADA